ncbi:MAG: hypothetical protein H6Q89_5023 [Myxococcaceae bacterium]|nr:hypothetical protein [Myxococcaceae bacterium]
MNAPILLEEELLYEALVDPQCEAIVVHCSDARLQRAFREFTVTELGLALGDFMPLVVSGGASVLAHPERLPKEFKFMRDRLEFYRSVMPSLKRVVLISHERCRYSQALKKRVLGRGVVPEAQGPEDLRVVQAALAPTLAKLDLRAELFFARFAGPEGTQIRFDRVG